MPTFSPTPAPTATEALRRTALAITNRARHAAVAPPLRLEPLLSQVAQRHAEEMALGAYFDHVDNAGRGVGERLLAAGYNYRWAGENISAGKADVTDVCDWWLSSDSHRANMLKPEFSAMGLGYFFIAQDARNFHHYWVQVLAALL